MKKRNAILPMLIILFLLSACNAHDNKAYTSLTPVETSEEISEPIQTSGVAEDIFLWPKKLQRVPSDDIYFTPEGEDYAYFVESQDGMIGSSNNLTALLYEFDENGNVCNVTQRSMNGTGEYQYSSFTKERHLQEAEQIERQKFICDKERLLCYPIENFAYSLFSQPEFKSFSFVNSCQTKDFSLIKYYTPGTDDYYILEIFIKTDLGIEPALHAIIIEFAKDGSTMQRTVLTKIPEINEAEYEAAKRKGLVLISEEDRVFMASGNQMLYHTEIDTLKQTKQSLVRDYLNSSESDTISGDYATAWAAGIGDMAISFSKPEFSEEQLALYNEAFKCQTWENAIVFEKNYEDKVTYTIGGDGENVKSIRWVIAFDEGKACSAYTIYDCYTGKLFDYGWTLYGNLRFLENEDCIYQQHAYFEESYFFGMNKEEAEQQMRDECAAAEQELISVESGGIEYTVQPSQYQQEYTTLPCPILTEEQIAERDTVHIPEGEGIYACGIEKYTSDEQYFIPITEDWQIEYDPLFPDEVILRCYDTKGKQIYCVRRGKSEAENITMNGGSSLAESVASFMPNTYAVKKEGEYVVYYFRMEDDWQTFPTVSDKAGALKYSLNDYMVHYFSVPQLEEGATTRQMYCTLEELQGLKYTQPATEDFLVLEERDEAGRYISSTIISYDETGIPVDIQMVFIYETSELAQKNAKLNNNECTVKDNAVIARNEELVYSEEQPMYRPENAADPKHRYIEYFESYASYAEAIAGNGVEWLSKPYLTTEQLGF